MAVIWKNGSFLLSLCRSPELRQENLNFRRPATPKIVTGPSEPRAGHWGTAKKTLLLRTHLVEYFLFSDNCLTTLFPIARRILSSMSELSCELCSRTPFQSSLVTSGFHREVYENCALLSHYAACSGDSLPTSRDNLTGPIFKGFFTLEDGMGPTGCRETAVNNYQPTLTNPYPANVENIVSS